MTARDNSHALYEELAVGHALSALEPEDELVFLSHLPGCAACTKAVAEHAETLGHLAYAAASDAPPPAILDAIRAGVAESGRAGAFPVPAPPVSPLSLDAARSRRQARTVRWSTAVLGAAASVVLLVALVLMNRGLQSKAQHTQQAADKVNAVVKTLAVNGSHEVHLSGDQDQSGVVVVNGSKVSFVAAGLPVNDKAHSVYVLWAKSRSGGVNAIGTFDITSGGPTVVNDMKVSDPAEVSRFIVTREPGRKAPALATQPAVVAGPAGST